MVRNRHHGLDNDRAVVHVFSHNLKSAAQAGLDQQLGGDEPSTMMKVWRLDLILKSSGPTDFPGEDLDSSGSLR